MDGARSYRPAKTLACFGGSGAGLNSAAGDAHVFDAELLNDLGGRRRPVAQRVIAAFTHLFSSPVGYGAGYYSYKWAEVLDAASQLLRRVEALRAVRNAGPTLGP